MTYTISVEGTPINLSTWILLWRTKGEDPIRNPRTFLFQEQHPHIPRHLKLEEDLKPLSKQARSVERCQFYQPTPTDYLRLAKIHFQPLNSRLLKSSRSYTTILIVCSQHSEKTQGVGWWLSQLLLRRISYLPHSCSINSTICIKNSRWQKKLLNQN